MRRKLLAQEEEDEEESGEEEQVEDDTEEDDEEEGEDTILPANAWRGKGFAVLAVWAGLAGIGLYVLGNLVSTIYLLIVSQGFQATMRLPAGLSTLAGFFSLTQ